MKFAIKISKGPVITILIFFCAQLIPASASDTQPSDQISEVVLSSQNVSNGSLLLLQIETRESGPPITNMQIAFQGRVYPVFPHPPNSSYSYFGLVSIPFRSATGPAKMALTWKNTAGSHTRTIPFKIVAGKYKTDVLKVDATRVNPSKKNLQRARKEASKVKSIYAAGSIARLWENDFQLPMASEITSPFGNKRVFNGQLKSYHNGIDFRAPIGTPVFAANSGVVKLAENLFYSGNVVIIDHGTRIFTIYAHLSKIEVTTGQHVKKGQHLGLTGATGRVNGPHLHWGVKANGIAVHPLQFVDIIASLVGKR